VTQPRAGPTMTLPSTANSSAGPTDPIEKLPAATAPTANR
jgi:hypothetical protein